MAFWGKSPRLLAHLLNHVAKPSTKPAEQCFWSHDPSLVVDVLDDINGLRAAHGNTAHPWHSVVAGLSGYAFSSAAKPSQYDRAYQDDSARGDLHLKPPYWMASRHAQSPALMNLNRMSNAQLGRYGNYIGVSRYPGRTDAGQVAPRSISFPAVLGNGLLTWVRSVFYPNSLNGPGALNTVYPDGLTQKWYEGGF